MVRGPTKKQKNMYFFKQRKKNNKTIEIVNDGNIIYNIALAVSIQCPTPRVKEITDFAALRSSAVIHKNIHTHAHSHTHSRTLIRTHQENIVLMTHSHILTKARPARYAHPSLVSFITHQRTARLRGPVRTRPDAGLASVPQPH